MGVVCESVVLQRVSLGMVLGVPEINFATMQKLGKMVLFGALFRRHSARFGHWADAFLVALHNTEWKLLLAILNPDLFSYVIVDHKVSVNIIHVRCMSMHFREYPKLMES